MMRNHVRWWWKEEKCINGKGKYSWGNLQFKIHQFFFFHFIFHWANFLSRNGAANIIQIEIMEVIRILSNIKNSYFRNHTLKRFVISEQLQNRNRRSRVYAPKPLLNRIIVHTFPLLVNLWENFQFISALWLRNLFFFTLCNEH